MLLSWIFTEFSKYNTMSIVGFSLFYFSFGGDVNIRSELWNSLDAIELGALNIKSPRLCESHYYMTSSCLVIILASIIIIIYYYLVFYLILLIILLLRM